MTTSKRVLPETDAPWSLMIISVGKSGEEKQYQQWLERTASTANDATGFLGTPIFRPYPGAREYIRQICFDSKGHLETWAHSACTEIAGRDHEEFIEYCDIQPIETVADAYSQPSLRRRKQWKQFLLTVGAVYLLILIISMLISAISRSAIRPFAESCATDGRGARNNRRTQNAVVFEKQCASEIIKVRAVKVANCR